MALPDIIKKPPVIIGGIILIVVILVISRRGSSSSGSAYETQVANVNAANSQIAQLNAQVEMQRIQAGTQVLQATLGAQVTQAQTEAQRVVALAGLASSENVRQAELEYQYDIANKQVENNRVLGLTAEDTKRLLSTQENQTRLQLGLTALDVNRFLGERALDSQEIMQARELTYRERELASNERVADFTSSRALTYATIQGNTQVQAIKAAKPSGWSTFLGGLGRGLGGGLTSLFGGL